MALPALITDAELLLLSLASSALTGVEEDTRTEHRQAASDFARSELAPRVSSAMSASFEPSHDVKAAIAAIAAYTLLCFRGFNPTKGSEKSIESRHAAAIAWFNRVKEGKAEVVGYAADRGGPLVGGSGSSNWEGWRKGGSS